MDKPDNIIPFPNARTQLAWYVAFFSSPTREPATRRAGLKLCSYLQKLIEQREEEIKRAYPSPQVAEGCRSQGDRRGDAQHTRAFPCQRDCLPPCAACRRR
jgi:hypothetical protein